MTPNALLKTMNLVHRVVIQLTAGRWGWHVGGMPVIELTTIGRRSHEPRRTMLTSPYQEGSTLVVVASRNGDDVHPAWYLNACANPAVMVSSGGGPARPMTAVVADEAQRARLWPLLTAAHPNYAGYQRKTKREIPVVLLQPVTTEATPES